MFLSLGEIMLRFCPGDHPLRAATQFTFSEGGGEYNVARGISRCFGIPASVATALVDNELGHLVHQMIRSSGVDTSNILWRDFDGIGKEVRNPLYFAERGFGHRAPKACMDRGHSAPSQLTTSDFDWDEIFATGEIRWFHTGGIFAGLSISTAEVAKQAMISARNHGIHVSYDPNYRASLWQAKDRGGVAAAAQLNSELAQYADTLFGVAPILTHSAPPQDLTELENLIEKTATTFPQVKQIALGRRHIHSASTHDYAATVWENGNITHIDGYKNIQVLDRIGSGDAFAAGYISQMLGNEPSPQTAILQGSAAAALTMSTPGDAVLCSAQDVYQLMNAKHSQESR